MRVEFSKEFEKAVRKLSGKMLDSVRQAVQEVINAGNIEELTDCQETGGLRIYLPSENRQLPCLLQLSCPDSG